MSAFDLQYQPLLDHTCDACHDTYQDRSRVSKHCPLCRPLVKAKRIEKQNARDKAKRAGRGAKPRQSRKGEA